MAVEQKVPPIAAIDSTVILKNWIVILASMAFVLFLTTGFFLWQFVAVNSTLKKSYLNYGFNSSWKIFQLVYAPYYNNIPNRVTSENYWKARRWFDQETRSLYDISTLEQYERDIDKVNSNTNLSGMFFREKFEELHPVFPIHQYVLTSSYGFRYNPFKDQKDIGPLDEEFHEGLDISSPKGQEVQAFLAGMVTNSRRGAGLGNYVEIDHLNGFKTRYAHMSARKVTNGQFVEKGQIIGLSGNTGRSTGPHLHFSLYFSNVTIDPYLMYPSYMYTEVH